MDFEEEISSYRIALSFASFYARTEKVCGELIFAYYNMGFIDHLKGIKVGDAFLCSPLPSRRCLVTTSDSLTLTLVHTSGGSLPLAELPFKPHRVLVELPLLLTCLQSLLSA